MSPNILPKASGTLHVMKCNTEDINNYTCPIQQCLNEVIMQSAPIGSK